MIGGDALGHVEFAVLDALHRGALRSRRTSERIAVLHGQPAGEAMLHDVLHRCERDGLIRGHRDGFGRQYELTAAGRARLSADRRFRIALSRVLVRSQSARR